jgi:hypothetical protein
MTYQKYSEFISRVVPRPVPRRPELLGSALKFTYSDKAVTIEVPSKDSSAP